MAFGGNLGGPDAIIARFSAVTERLSVLWGVPKISGNYRSALVGPVQQQADFINAVVAWWPEPRPTPEDALALLQILESEHGRERGLIGGARTLDLDLLLHGGERRDRPGLCVPHARMAERAFVLRPLRELFGDAFQWHPDAPSVGELLSQPNVARQSCQRLAGD